MTEIKRIGRNIGRIEILAVREQVTALLKDGYDLKKIHTRLREAGKITMSYPTFCYQFKQLNRQAPAASTKASPPLTPKRKPSGISKADASEGFSINPNPEMVKF